MGDGELILLVEDNDKVREATANRLESLGYAVLEAKTGPEAITLLKSGEPIALVFSDIVMPGGMTGYDVAEWVRSMKPELKVLLTTGYSEMPLAVSEAARKIKVLGEALHAGTTRLRTPRSTRRLMVSGCRQSSAQRWARLCASCFDVEAEKANVRYSLVNVTGTSWSDQPPPRDPYKRKR